jgi:hypothetical protein
MDGKGHSDVIDLRKPLGNHTEKKKACSGEKTIVLQRSSDDMSQLSKQKLGVIVHNTRGTAPKAIKK